MESPRNLFVGFKPKELESQYNKVYDLIRERADSIGHNFNNILWTIREHWASPEAVVVGENFAERFNKYDISFRNSYANIIETIKSAGENWKATTGYQDAYFPSKKQDILSGHYNIKSQISDNINGVVGADPDFFFSDFKNVLQSQVDAEKMFHKQLIQTIEGLAFIGQNQVVSLTASVTSVTNSFERVIQEVYTEVLDEAISAARKYRDTAGTIYSEFEKLYNDGE